MISALTIIIWLISYTFFQQQRSDKGNDSEEREENIVGNILQLAILSYY